MSKSSRRPAAPRLTAQQATLAEQVAQQLRHVVFDALEQLGGPPSADRPALTLARSAQPIAPARMAAALPRAEDRAQATTLYERCLAHYRHVVRAEDAAHGIDDVGAAVACFVAANLKALHGVQATPDQLLRLERQLAGVVQVTAAWPSAVARERQAYFEQMAIVSVLVSESADRAVGPVAQANVRAAARRYLQQMFGLDPEQLTLGEHGLALRVTDMPAQATAAQPVCV
jgi:hypothetical protein